MILRVDLLLKFLREFLKISHIESKFRNWKKAAFNWTSLINKMYSNYGEIENPFARYGGEEPPLRKMIGNRFKKRNAYEDENFMYVNCAS